ncbi:TetR/AcrR family transcriptional regulator [Streptomyces sp. TRM 70361]|uniref:TetR/AcrR family transcriptional regulator n=1 Tax=Streptomyces sp. TRM 70361 TaxID=3116553 RepID=UPI002E7C3669|nr:TetR/AcrR family transcriptional regulator [Streptomyces sp. TRM 70361]MEE1938427.1 TetR/AcrR family transcriptional regulator [Streptomyces sp. TRM 70361]
MAATGTTAPRGTVPPRRADAVRNRERIVAAAGQAFVLYGSDASLDDIARRAGVGNATLYRHFPDREALAYEVVLAVVERIADRALAALEECGPDGGGVDPFEALRRFVTGAAQERVGALCPLLDADFDSEEPRLLAARRRLEGAVEELFERARRAGRLRADADTGDLLMAVGQLTRPLPGADCARLERFSGRHLQIYLDGLRAPAESRLPGRAATLEALRQAD